MKNLISILFLSFIIISCNSIESDEVIQTVNNQTKNKENVLSEINNLGNIDLNSPEYSNNELIVQYEQGTTESQKNTIRSEFIIENHTSIKVCDNCDGTIEKWTFSSTIDVNLEHKKTTMKRKLKGPRPEGLMNVDNEFHFNTISGTPLSTSSSYFNYINNDNHSVKIAVLDSGINMNSFSASHPFLFDSQQSIRPYSSGSGWNFVNSDDNCHDDFGIQHGTKVSYVITSKLDVLGTPYQILPVKVSKSTGKTSYFDIICGVSFASDKVDIVQMSFGWYETENNVNSIFKELLHRYENQVLYVTSAGNNGLNNDDEIHYPSSFDSNNVLAIAAIDESLDHIADFSNYGLQSVDFYAPGENVMYNGVPSLSGTSYAAPYVSAVAADILFRNNQFTPIMIINELNNVGREISQIEEKGVKYNKLIN